MAAPAPQMLTANRLSDGVVLYWKQGVWVEALADGEVLADNAAADAALVAAQASIADNAVVGVYLFDLRADGSPVKEREIIRAAGPSVREDLGKQSHPPLEGGSKNPKDFSGRGRLRPSPKSASQISTLPQGEGQPDEPDVSI